MSQPVAMRGRPSLYTPELAEEICERIATTPRGLSFICAVDSGLPDERTVARWISTRADFCQMYRAARERQADLLFDESLEIADDSSGDLKIITRKDGSTVEACDTEFVMRSTLRVNTRLKMAAQLAPRKYGNKQMIELAGEIAVEDKRTVDVSALDYDQREALRAALEAASAQAALDVTPRGGEDE